MATKRIANGQTLHVDHDVDAAYTAIGNIRSIAQPGITRESVNVTCLESTFEEDEPSPIVKYENLTITIFWDESDTDHLILETLATSGAKVPWRIDGLGDGTVEKGFTGWITSLGEVNYEIKNEITRDIEIVLTTAITTT